jgi:hypothetical protein
MTGQPARRPGECRFLRGDRVELTAVTDDYLRFAFKIGDRGTVEMTDSLATVHVRWDSGARIGITAESAGLIRKIGGEQDSASGS